MNQSSPMLLTEQRIRTLWINLFNPRASPPSILPNGTYTLLVRFRHLFRISFASPSAIFKKMLIPLPDSVVLVHAVAMGTGPPSLQTARRQSIISQDGGYAFSIKKRGKGSEEFVFSKICCQDESNSKNRYMQQLFPTVNSKLGELYSRALSPRR